MTQQHTIQTQHQTLLQTLDQIEAEHAMLSAQLVENPEDIDLLEAVEKASEKIQSTKTRIDLFRAAAGEKAARDAAAARLAEAVEARDEAAKIAARRVAVAKEIDASMASFARLMKEYASLNEQALQATRRVVNNATNKRLFDLPHFSAAARSLLSDALVSALHNADIAKLAPGAVNLTGRAGSDTFTDMATRAADSLVALLDAELRGV